MTLILQGSSSTSSASCQAQNSTAAASSEIASVFLEQGASQTSNYLGGSQLTGHLTFWRSARGAWESFWTSADHSSQAECRLLTRSAVSTFSNIFVNTPLSFPIQLFIDVLSILVVLASQLHVWRRYLLFDVLFGMTVTSHARSCMILPTQKSYAGMIGRQMFLSSDLEMHIRGWVNHDKFYWRMDIGHFFCSL